MAELGAEIARDYAGREPLLVAPLKASVVFLADLSRALPILHALDFVELAGYGAARDGRPRRSGCSRTSTSTIAGRDVLIVEDVVDTGLTLDYLVRAASPARARESLGRGDAARPPVPAPRRRPARRATSASRCPTSSSSATASAWTSAGARCRTCTSSCGGAARRDRRGVRRATAGLGVASGRGRPGPRGSRADRPRSR